MSAADSDVRIIIEECFQKPNEPETLRRLHHSLWPLLRAILAAMYRGDPSLADDAYQSAFVKYLELFRAGRKPGIDYEAYFVAVAKNCLVDEIRRQRGHISIDDLFEEQIPQEQGESERIEACVLVLQALTRLEPRCRFIIESYYIAELDSGQLAERLGINGDSVYMAVKRCRDRLKIVVSSR